MFCRSQIPHRRHRVTGHISGGLVSEFVQYQVGVGGGALKRERALNRGGGGAYFK